jgi:hypothetical protein
MASFSATEAPRRLFCRHGHRCHWAEQRTGLVSLTPIIGKQAQKDARKLAASSPALKHKARALQQLLAHHPYSQQAPY